MKKNIEKVAIVKCESYNQKDIDLAVSRILKLLEFPTNKYKNVLIKPNIIGYFKENLDVRYINKFLGLLALEIWNRIFITKEINSDTKLSCQHIILNYNNYMLSIKRILSS